MAKQGITTGTTPDDGNGDNLLAGAVKINSNFDEVYGKVGDGTNLYVGIVSSLVAGTNVSISTSFGQVTISADDQQVGVSTYSDISGIATSAGIATEAVNAGIATYATTAGVSTSVSGNLGIGVTGTDVNIAGLVTATQFSGNISGTAATFTTAALSGLGTFAIGAYSVGIVTALNGLSGNVSGTAATFTGAVRSGSAGFTIDTVYDSWFTGGPGQLLIDSNGEGNDDDIFIIRSSPRNTGGGSNMKTFCVDSESDLYLYSHKTNGSYSYQGKKFVVLGGSANPYSASNNNFSPVVINCGVTSVTFDLEGHIGIGTTRPTSTVGSGNTVKVATGIVTAYQYYGDLSPACAGRWILGADGTDHYTFSGPGLGSSTTNDPTLYLQRGRKYAFSNQSGGHPFRLQSTANGSTGTQWNVGVTNNDAADGTDLLFEVPFGAPNTLYYQCTSHANMGGSIVIYPNI